MKILVAGWFSFEYSNVTAGDVMARDVVCEWLDRADYPYDVALAPSLKGGVDWRSVNPKDYTDVVFVCGPFPLDQLTVGFLEHFKDCRLLGLDLSMIEPVTSWNPFDVLFARDSSTNSHPDLTFLSHQTKVPIVGVILVHPQHEYGQRSKHDIANNAIKNLIDSREMVALQIDTGLDPNTTNLRTAAEVESLIAHMDVVVTTRLHGTVLALKNGVPVVAIDAISGGAKVSCQATTIGWDVVFSVDDLTEEKLQQAFDYCLTAEACSKAKTCRERAAKAVEQVRDEFITALGSSNSSTRVWSQEAIEKAKILSSDSSKLRDRLLGMQYKIKGGIRRWLYKKLFRAGDKF